VTAARAEVPHAYPSAAVERLLARGGAPAYPRGPMAQPRAAAQPQVVAEESRAPRQADNEPHRGPAAQPRTMLADEHRHDGGGARRIQQRREHLPWMQRRGDWKVTTQGKEEEVALLLNQATKCEIV